MNTTNLNKDSASGIQPLPSYDELVYALKDTHNLYLEAVKDKYLTRDITRVMTNDYIFKRIEINNKQ